MILKTEHCRDLGVLKYLQFGIWVLLCNGLMMGHAMAAVDPMDWLERGWGEQTYVPPGEAELKQAEELFFALMNTADPLPLAPDAKAIGYELHSIRKDLYVLAESDARREGRGMYLFRTGRRMRLGLQAPHARADLHTGRILMKLMFEHSIAAGALNTVSRNAPIAGQDGNADMAHLEDTFFIAFSRAFARTYPKGRIVQLHGFAPEKRKTAAGRASDAIVSSGQKRPSLDAISIRECLNYRYLDAVNLYPINVFELGGETNTIGQMLRARGFFGFVHLELAPRPRQKLRRDPAARQDFMHCVANGVEMHNP